MTDELFAIICDDDGGGICGVQLPGLGMTACVSAKRALAEKMYAQAIAPGAARGAFAGKSLRLIRFTRVEDITPPNGQDVVH